MVKNVEDMFIHFYRIHECNRQIDRETNRQTVQWHRQHSAFMHKITRQKKHMLSLFYVLKGTYIHYIATRTACYTSIVKGKYDTM